MDDMEKAGRELLDAVSAAFTTGVIGAAVDQKQLLEMIVRTAAHILGAAAATLYLVDKKADELVFHVTIGPKAAEVKQFRLPIGQGIAGLVAATGQPMAISNAQDHPDLAVDIADKIGYRPNNMLCMPLVHEDEVVGVLQLMDKADASSFTPEDMQDLALFAEQAAAAIDQARLLDDVSALVIHALRSAGALPDSEVLRERIEKGVQVLGQDPVHGRSSVLALLVRDIARRGEAESKLCETILVGLVDYLDSKPGLHLFGEGQ